MLHFFRLYREAVFVWPVWIVWFVASAITAIADPFVKPVQFTLTERAMFWPVLIAVAVLLGIGWRVVVREYLCPQLCAFQILLIGVLCSVTLAPVILLEAIWLIPGYVPTLHDAAMCAFYVLLVSIVVSVLRRLSIGEISWFRPDAAREPRLFDRLEECERGTLWRMQVRDHYVDVVTCQGISSVLMRFSDAIAEVGEVAGAQVHRSHWVAREAVTGSRSEKNKCWVTTADGAEIPVSRTYRAEAEAAGMLPPA